MFAFKLGGNFLNPLYQFQIISDDCFRIIKQELAVRLLDIITLISGDFRQLKLSPGRYFLHF